MTPPEMIEAKVAEFEQYWSQSGLMDGAADMPHKWRADLHQLLTDTYNKGKHDGYAEEGIKCYEHSKAEYERGREEGYTEGCKMNDGLLDRTYERGLEDERTRVEDLLMPFIQTWDKEKARQLLSTPITPKRKA